MVASMCSFRRMATVAIATGAATLLMVGSVSAASASTTSSSATTVRASVAGGSVSSEAALLTNRGNVDSSCEWQWCQSGWYPDSWSCSEDRKWIAITHKTKLCEMNPIQMRWYFLFCLHCADLSEAHEGVRPSTSAASAESGVERSRREPAAAGG